MKASKRLQQLEDKITDLKSQQQMVLDQRHTEIARMVTRVGLESLDDNVLVGALLEIQGTAATHPEQKEVWRKSGEMFLKKFSLKTPPNDQVYWAETQSFGPSD